VHADFYRGAWVAVMPTVSGGVRLDGRRGDGVWCSVIASAQGALGELVRSGENGLLVSVDDPRRSARALRAVVR